MIYINSQLWAYCVSYSLKIYFSRQTINFFWLISATITNKCLKNYQNFPKNKIKRYFLKSQSLVYHIVTLVITWKKVNYKLLSLKKNFFFNKMNTWGKFFTKTWPESNENSLTQTSCYKVIFNNIIIHFIFQALQKKYITTYSCLHMALPINLKLKRIRL